MTSHSPNQLFATDIIRTLRSAGHIALLAGGCVRDKLLGRIAKDFDVATTATPDQVRNLFGKSRTLSVGASFGVIVVLPQRDSGAGQVEVATFRTEGPYLDGRRPERVSYCTPEEDARRRDFTINGMFYDPIDGKVFDFVGGEADLASHVLRAIGEPHERMREDKLRMLRAVRFAATLEFELETKTATAIQDMAQEITIVSAERIAQELRRMLIDSHRRRAMELCSRLNLLKYILPEISSGIDEPTLKMLSLLEHPSFELAFAVLLHQCPTRPTVHELCRRLKLSNDELERTEWLVAHQDDLIDAPSLSLARLKRIFAHSQREELISLMRVKLLALGKDLQPAMFCSEYLSRTSPSDISPVPLLTGDDLKNLGFSPGPNFKTLLDTVRDAQLNGEISTRNGAIELAMKMK